MTVTFDVAPLSAPIAPQDFRAFQATPVGRVSADTKSAAHMMLSVALLFCGLVSVATIAMALLRRSAPPGMLILVAGALALGAVIGYAAFRVRRQAAHTAYRLSLFARANGMEFAGTVPDPPYSGMIFGLGTDRTATNVVRARHPRDTEFGDYRYVTGSNKDRRVHTWTYITVRIDNLLPHIVLEARGNGGSVGSRLPVAFGPQQRLSLEGDFDRHFALYAPEGYERDALYLFTPDVMQAFISTAGAFDVEIVDNRVFFSSRTRVDRLSPQEWERQFHVVQALLAKVDQWERWRDDRLIDPDAPAGAPLPLMTTPAPLGVAAPGRRLRRRFSWVWGVVGAAVVGWWVFDFVMRTVVR